jgi:hypothetical protein
MNVQAISDNAHILALATATVSSARMTVPAGEIIAKVQNNQPINYDSVIFQETWTYAD